MCKNAPSSIVCHYASSRPERGKKITNMLRTCKNLMLSDLNALASECVNVHLIVSHAKRRYVCVYMAILLS
jgi:hypothetical protein